MCSPTVFVDGNLVLMQKGWRWDVLGEGGTEKGLCGSGGDGDREVNCQVRIHIHNDINV